MHKINVPEVFFKCVLTNNEQQTELFCNNVIWRAHGVCFIESQNNKIVIKVCFDK